MYRALRNPFASRSASSDQISIGFPTASSQYNDDVNSFPDLASPDSIKPASPQFADATSAFAPSKKVLQDYQRWLKDNGKDEQEMERNHKMPHFDDPVGMHLLVETAMGDSEQFKILSVEEVEELKREKTRLTAQMESLRRKLALEAKVRDAAASLSRLYTRKGHSMDSVPTLKRHKRSQKGSDASIERRDSDALSNTEDELAISTQKCEEISKQLWDTDIKYRAVEGQLLRHTAGVLQATHAGPRVRMKGTEANGLPRPQPPDSPQSVYSTMDKTQSMAAQDADLFDDRSFYREVDQLDGFVDRLRARQSSVYGADPDKPLPQPPQSAAPDSFTMSSIASRLAASNKRLLDLLRETRQEAGPLNFPEPPAGSSPSPQDQMDYLDDLAYEVERTYRELAFSKSSTELSDIMARVWDMVVADEQSAQEWKQQQRQNPTQETASGDDDNDDGTSDFPLNDPFSPEAFSTRIRQLCTRAATLRDQQTSLRRQLYEQRSLATAHTTDLDTLQDDLRQARARHAAAETETGDARAEVASLSAELDRLRDAADATEKRAAELQAQVDAAPLPASASTATVAPAENQASATATAEADARALRAETELRALESEVVRLTTELTVAKAELDSAQGPRSQRSAAAAAAANGASAAAEAESLRREVNTLTSRNRALATELEALVSAHEELVRAGVEAERVQEDGERVVEGWRERCEGLEARLAEERIRWMGVKSPGAAAVGSPGGTPAGAETTSTGVLKSEFKRMMRDTRAENWRVLKAEQEERRKLEALVRQLRKENAPPKSALSQSTLAA
ncbi:MAG: hypothetical protein M1821_002046 [Bathelium mastoideum]|nr:MAG: hypothetical protein M1821_002046 [Bathelium mastoideum]